MIRFLDGLALLKEVDMINGVRYTSTQLRKMYPDKIVVIRHTSYIYRDVLCDIASKCVTNLDDYVQMGELIDNLGIQKSIIKERIRFMEHTGARFFEYIIVSGIQFIKLDSEFKYLFQNYQPFVAEFSDAHNLIHCKLLGEIKIGFY